MNQVFVMLEELDINQEKSVVLAGDFNFFSDTKLEAMCENPTLKKKLVGKLLEIKESFELCDIWRIRNPSSQRYTFRDKHCSYLIQ